jgi:LemA protein
MIASCAGILSLAASARKRPSEHIWRCGVGAVARPPYNAWRSTRDSEVSVGYIILIIAASFVGWAIFTYNRLVRLRVRAEEAWRDVDTQLKRRWDLIPALVDVVKGYAAHEEAAFRRVAEARGKAVEASGPREQAFAEDGLKASLRPLFLLFEDYPQLKADERFAELATTMEEIEDTVQRSRRYYNAIVRDLNNAVEMVPSRWIARLFRFAAREFYLLPGEEQRRAPEGGWR